MSCRYVASDQPRVLRRHHLEDCAGEPCEGCRPCTEAHCRVCGVVHADGTCPACQGEAREDLQAIGKLCADLAAEAVIKGVDSEAMNLMAPAANPEAWGHITTSLKVGRLPSGYLQCDRCDNSWPCSNPKHATGELHPLFVLVTWEEVWRDALDHETDALVTIAEAVRYLGVQLTYMAGYEHAPFEDFARDLRRCRAHLEAVLHDGEQRDTGAPCLKCDVPQVRTWRGWELPWSTKELPKRAAEDGWACPRCKTFSNKAQYDQALKDDYRKRAIPQATWLTATDMEIRTTVKASTVRSWGRDEQPDPRKVRKRRDSERTLYCVADVITERDKGTMCA